MDSRQLKTLALVAGAAILVTALALVATRPTGQVPQSFEEAVELFRDLLQLRLENKDSDLLRKQLLASLRGLPPDPARDNLRHALQLFAEKKYDEAANERVNVDLPMAWALRGVALVELGKKDFAAADLKKALELGRPDWVLRKVLEETLKKI